MNEPQKSGEIQTEPELVAAADETTGAGEWIVATGREAINRTERLLCGDHAVRSVSVAEGLALTGLRAATLIDADAALETRQGGPTADVAWVCHRVGNAWAGPTGSARFELVAADGQEAVDHCVAAHLIAGAVDAPGICTVDRETADRTSFVRLPDPARIEGHGQVASSSRGGVLPVAVEVLGGAKILPAYRADDADLLLVATGETRGRAVRLADDLRRAGIACGVIGVALLRPFPAELLRQAVADRRVAVVGELADAVARVIGVGRVVRLADPGGGPLDLPEALCREIGLERPRDLAESGSEPQSPAFAAAIEPPDATGERLLLDSVLRIAGHTRPCIARGSLGGGEALTIALGDGPTLISEPERVDLGILRFPAAADGPDGEMLLARLDAGSVLWIVSEDDDASHAWSSLGARRRARILNAHPGLYWSRPCDELAERIATSVAPAAAGQIDRPAALQIDALEEALARDGFSGRSEPVLPRMVGPETRSEADRSSGEIRRFHLTGDDSIRSDDQAPLTALAERVVPSAGPWSRYPFVLSTDGEQSSVGEPLAERFVRSIEQIANESGTAFGILARASEVVARLSNRLLRDRVGRLSTGSLLSEVLDVVPAELDLSAAGETELRGEIEKIGPALPASGYPVAFDERTLSSVVLEAVRARRRSAREEFRRRARSLVEDLETLLQSDDRHGPAGSSADALRSTLGTGQHFVDPEALSRSLPSYRGSAPIEATRRLRMERAVSRLNHWLAETENEPDTVVVGSEIEIVDAGTRLVRHPDGLLAAIGLFDGYADRFVDVVRAFRTARLEAAGEYDPELHDRLIEELGTAAFSIDEMLQLPAVVAVETARRLGGQALASFSTLLRSGRPVLVVVPDDTTAAGSALDSDLGYDPGLGYLAIAHREAFVLQSTLARPEHLVDGLSRMATIQCPGVAVVAIPHTRSSLPPWTQLMMALWGRDAPCFVYDPLAGPTWAERFTLDGSPEPDAAWPSATVEIRDPNGDTSSMELRFTAAHSALVGPRGRRHARVISPDEWAADQIEIDAYLERQEDQRRRLVPFLWVVNADGGLARAVLTRELANVAADRHRAWRVLQELAGYHNEYAHRASKIAWQEAREEARAEHEKLGVEHAEQLERVRSEASGETIDRLVAVLMDLDSIPSRTGIASVRPDPPAPVESHETGEAETAEPAKAESAEEEISFDEPYIDSVLCTTCNECTNLNPRMFVYNEDRQAILADLSAGTFEQLVKAAEKCPARCIHPGVPRTGDPSVNDDLLERSRVFN